MLHPSTLPAQVSPKKKSPPVNQPSHPEDAPTEQHSQRPTSTPLHQKGNAEEKTPLPSEPSHPSASNDPAEYGYSPTISDAEPPLPSSRPTGNVTLTGDAAEGEELESVDISMFVTPARAVGEGDNVPMDDSAPSSDTPPVQ